MSADRTRLLVILPVVAALVWLVPESRMKWPIVTIALGLPLLLGLVPKNLLYGHRTLHTLRSSDEVWYLHNRFTGIAMVVGGCVWLAFVLR